MCAKYAVQGHGANRNHSVPNAKNSRQLTYNGKHVGEIKNGRDGREFRWSQSVLRFESKERADIWAYSLSKGLKEKLESRNVETLYIIDADQRVKIDDFSKVLQKDDNRFNKPQDEVQFVYKVRE